MAGRVAASIVVAAGGPAWAGGRPGGAPGGLLARGYVRGTCAVRWVDVGGAVGSGADREREAGARDRLGWYERVGRGRAGSIGRVGPGQWDGEPHAGAAADRAGRLRADRLGDGGGRRDPGPSAAAVLVGGGLRAVVLVNADGQDLCGWLPFARSLARVGLRAVLYDRPAGDQATVLRGLSTWLRDRGTTGVAYVGAGSGASVALTAAAESPGPFAVVAVSPPAVAPTRRGTLAVAATGDLPGAAAARRLAAAGGTLRLAPGSARGPALLAGAPGTPLVSAVLDHLRR